MTHMERLHAFIQSHGFQSWTYSGVIEIAIPWTHSDGRTGEFIERCEPTLSAVKRALGY